MCRLVYILNNRHVKKLLMDFLEQSEHPAKYTPGLNSKSDAITHPDGFGLAYFNSITHRWKMIKTPKQYRAVPNLSTLLNNVAVSPLVIGHIRKQSNASAPPTLENTHPFSYRNQLFVHNGYLPQFDCISPSIKNKLINKHFLTHIKGQTDSEWMFYLFLTVMENYKYTTPIELEEMLANCVDTWLSILKGLFSQFNANIIYANKSHSVVTRYCYGASTKHAPSLYFHNNHGEHDKILLSSEPLNEHYVLIPENTVIVINHALSVAGHISPVYMRDLE